MRVLYLSLTPSMRLDDPSGYATHMRGVWQALGEAGHEVVLSVAAGGCASPAPDIGATSAMRLTALHEADRGSLKDRLPGGLRHLLRDLRELALDRRARPRLRRLITAQGIEAIYERAGLMQTAGLEIAAAAGLPHVLEINTPLEERRDFHGFPLYRVGVRRQRCQLTLADQISCISSPLARYLVDRGMDGNRVHIIPNAVQPAAYELSADARREQRAALGIGEHQIAVGFVGRFGFWRGMMPLVEALAAVLREESTVHAVLIGDGQLMPEVRRYIAGSGLTGRFTLTGSLDWRQVPARVAALDIGLMASSNWYSSPLKIFEYGAAGLCVVAPCEAPIAEVMEDGIDGVLVPSDETGVLATAVMDLVRTPERRRQMAARFRKKVIQQYTWSQVGEKITALFDASSRRRMDLPSRGAPCVS